MTDPITVFNVTSTNPGFDDDPTGETERKQRNIIRKIKKVRWRGTMMKIICAETVIDGWRDPYWICHDQ
jgi:hypothetical protein